MSMLLKTTWIHETIFTLVTWKTCSSKGLRFSRAPTFVATPLWAKCEDETHTPKSGNWKSSGTPATLELDSRRKNTFL